MGDEDQVGGFQQGTKLLVTLCHALRLGGQLQGGTHTVVEKRRTGRLARQVLLFGPGNDEGVETAQRALCQTHQLHRPSLPRGLEIETLKGASQPGAEFHPAHTQTGVGDRCRQLLKLLQNPLSRGILGKGLLQTEKLKTLLQGLQIQSRWLWLGIQKMLQRRGRLRQPVQQTVECFHVWPAYRFARCRKANPNKVATWRGSPVPWR